MGFVINSIRFAANQNVLPDKKANVSNCCYKPVLKTLTNDTVSFSSQKLVETSNKYVDHKTIPQLTEQFTARLLDLKKDDRLNVDNIRKLINSMIPGKNVSVKNIQQAKEIEGFGELTSGIYGVFNPTIDPETHEMKFDIYYDFSPSKNSDNEDLKLIAQVHEFVHMLQTNTEMDYKLTKTALSYPDMAQLSYPQMSGIFHALEYQLYNNSNLPEEKYGTLIKDIVDNYYSRSDTIPVLEFIMVKAFDESQAHAQSLQTVKDLLKPAEITPDSPYQIVYDTVPIYMKLAKAALNILKDERQKLLKEKDIQLIDFYSDQLNKLDQQYQKINLKQV